MTPARAVKGDHIIRYRLQRDCDRVKLHLWEPSVGPTIADARPSPYLYALNFTFTTVGEAESFLHEHLLSNGALDVPETNFPDEGEIAILPFPTWGMDSGP